MTLSINTLNSDIAKLKFHNSCLLYLIGELRDDKKTKFPTMQEVCVLFDLSNDDLKVILKHIKDYQDVDELINTTLPEFSQTISADGLLFIIKGIKNSVSGKLKKSCKSLLKDYKNR